MLLLLPSRADAQGWLGRLGGGRAAQELGSADAQTRADAAEELGRWGEPRSAVAALNAALEAEREVTVRSAIVRALARRRDPAAVAPLVAALESAQSLDPASVVLALGAFDDDRAARALVAALGREDVQDAAVRALDRMGPRAVPHLIRALDEPALGLAAIRVLGLIGDPRATQPLTARLASPSEELRIAAVRALGDLGDRRAGPALGERLDDPSAQVVFDSLVALGRSGEPGQAHAVASRVARGPPAHRRAALRALVALDPASAIPVMERAVASGDAVLARAAIDLALECTHARAVPLLFGLVREGSHAEQAAGALAEVQAGAGVPVLVRLAEEEDDQASPTDGPLTPSTRALSVALRKHRDSIDEALYERALAAIAAAEMSVERSLVLRSVARDPRVGPLLVSSLGADDASVRAAAARGLELLADRRYSPAVAAALASERDSEVFRRLAAAATLLGAEVPYPALRRQLSSIETASEALVAAAGSLSRYGARRSSYLRSAFREALRAEDPRVRAGAARALLVCDDREAWRALVFTLDDAVPEVRLAAASALAHLAVAEATPAIEARWRVEEDPRVLPALLDAAAAPDRRPVRAPELGGRAGDESVRVRIVAVGEEGRSGVPVEILLPDGRWLRMRTLPSGELVIVDLPAAVVDVRVKVAE